jgi:hypothetical protein
VEDRNLQREQAAKAALADVVFLLHSDPEIQAYEQREGEFDNDTFLKLLDQSFRTLDPDNNGISRSELMAAIIRPEKFSRDQYVMISLAAKYFDLIVNMSDDEPGEETVITRRDQELLANSLKDSHLNLAELHRWCFRNDKSVTPPEAGMGPPPMAHGS